MRNCLLSVKENDVKITLLLAREFVIRAFVIGEIPVFMNGGLDGMGIAAVHVLGVNCVMHTCPRQ